MDIITVDYETFWSQSYTLSKLSPLEYVMGDEFEVICCAIKKNDEPSQVYFGFDAVAARFAELDIASCALLAHNNSGFDAYISAYRFHLRPKMWLCTAAMARPIHAKTIGVSLRALVKHYGVGVKDDAILHSTRGKHLADFTEVELSQMATYNREDTDQCYALFQKLRPFHSASELWQIDALTRMRTEPAFALDEALLRAAHATEVANKRNALVELAGMLHFTGDFHDEDAMVECVRSSLASAPKFSQLLEARGVATPLKPSPTNPDKQVPALAKTDQAFLDLQEHHDPVVSTAARARLAVKSTLLETRITKFLTANKLAGGRLPVPVRFCGADTSGRDSGEEYNPQNLPRIDADRPKLTDCLRNSLVAPEGKLVIVADQSGIELRTNHTLWQVPSSMELWKANPTADLYRAFAAENNNCTPEQVTKFQRQAAKVAQLQLQFGSGWRRYQSAAAIPWGLILTDEEAQRTTSNYREYYSQIAEGWDRCDEALEYIAAGQHFEIDPWGLCYTEKDAVVLPSGRRIRYPDLRREYNKKRGRVEWVYGHGRHKASIYGAKMVENIVQALARDSIFDCSVDYFRKTGLRPTLRVHDELAYVVPKEQAKTLLDSLQSILRTPPRWWPQLTVWSEGSIGRTYGEAK